MIPKRDWEQLDELDRAYVRWQVRRKVVRALKAYLRSRLDVRSRLSAPMRLVGWVWGSVLFVMLAAPPIHELPPVALPVFMAGALAMALMLYGLAELWRNRIHKT